MVFSSTIFLLVFLPVVLAGNYILKGNSARNVLLLIASILFYAWGEPVYVFLMLGSITGNFFFGILLGRTRQERGRKHVLILACIFNLGILFYFKYFNFVAENLYGLFGIPYTYRSIRLPIGISFFTFQALSYVIDVYRGNAEPQRNPLNLGLYIAFFPQLIAGPIVRYNSIEHQLKNRSASMEILDQGITSFIIGFSKKVLIANNLASLSSYAAMQTGGRELSVLLAWIGSLAYTFQIYFDFSGYSDMAIGLGKMFGFEFEENFNYPYISSTITEFWRRWHISLSRWFRDYVYIPLGGSRTVAWKRTRNLLIVWLLTGIWHGAAWQFIIWGLVYGLLIVVEKIVRIPERTQSGVGRFLGWFVTFLIVNANWVLFSASSLRDAWYQLGAMLGIGATGLTDGMTGFMLREYRYCLIAAVILSTPILRRVLERIKERYGQSPLFNMGKAIICMSALVISLSYLAMGMYNPFIYFNF